MRAYLVDFETAERIKTSLSEGGSLEFTDVQGLPHTQTAREIADVLSPQWMPCPRRSPGRCWKSTVPALRALSGRRRQQTARIAGTGGPGSGDGSQTVAVAGNHFANTVYSDTLDLNDPAYTTPLGIAASAGLGLISDSCQVLLNGAPAKLFRSGSLTAMELLMMNGYTYSDLLGRSGKPLSVKVDGKPRVFHGEPAQPARLRINGADAAPTRWCMPETMWISPGCPRGPTAACAPGSGPAAPHPLPHHQRRRRPSGRSRPAGAVIVKTGQQRAVPPPLLRLDGYPQRCPAGLCLQAGRSPLLSHGPSGNAPALILTCEAPGGSAINGHACTIPAGSAKWRPCGNHL
jgi:hypothetical protein